MSDDINPINEIKTTTSEPSILAQHAPMEVSSSTSEPPSAPGSVVSSVSSRPSGLKPPSKIGRLCSHTAPKPAVPTTPRADGGNLYDDQPKHSDEYSRKYLSDLLELDEEYDSTKPTSSRDWPSTFKQYRKTSTSSTASGNSMEQLWEKHPRRLSEAGLRRSSDHSVVLTEDTDSFIIGDHVWVGGSKAGQIAYIGETQFAPGEWAGIVLDEPIGKNDGSVAGVRYFQCAEKRGVFSRLTRLTRSPMFTHAASPASEAGSSVYSSRPPTANGNRRSPAPVPTKTRRAHSPNGSLRSAVSSRMNQSVTSSHISSGEVKVGERVIVSSSQGSKAGTLRFMGPTEFASGVWCGVELDDPIGKNDGSVEGKRYFECPPRYGLFAPIAKVSRSPSSRRPGHCMVHHTPMRRSNSRDSLTSFTTSIASTRPASRISAQRLTSTPRNVSSNVTAKNALQELLREKQHHIERLMKERELERTEVAKFTLQAERAETSLAQVKTENNLTLKENQSLKIELDKMRKKLEDEKQRVEDLLFRNEEDNIHKEEFNKLKEALEVEKTECERKITELEASVSVLEEAVNTARAAISQADSAHALELETLRAQHNEEVQSGQVLSSELQKLLDEAYALLKEKEHEKESIGKSMNEEINRLKMELEKRHNETKSKMAVAQTEFDAQMTVMSAKLQAAETKLELEKNNSEKAMNDHSTKLLELTTKLSQTQASLDDQTQELNKVSCNAKEQELSLTKEINKLKMELSAKLNDLEESSQNSQKQNQLYEQLQLEIKQVKNDYENKIKEFEVLLNETSKQNDTYSEEILDLKSKLSSKTIELEKYLSSAHDSSTTSEKLITEYKCIIRDRDKEINDLKTNILEFDSKNLHLADIHKKEIEEKNSKISELNEIIAKHIKELENAKINFDAISSTVAKTLDDISKLTNENQELKSEIDKLSKANKELNEIGSSLKLELSEVKRELASSKEKCSELETTKEKLENDINLINNNSNDSNEQINSLTQTLRSTEKELQELRDKNRNVINAREKIEQELNLKITQLNYSLENEKEKTQEVVSKSRSEIEALMSKLSSTNTKVTNLEKEMFQSSEQCKSFEKLNERLKSEIDVYKTQCEENKLQLKELQSKHTKEIEILQSELDVLKGEGNISEIKLQEKVDQLVEAQNDLNLKLEQARSNEEQLQKRIQEITENMTEEKKLADVVIKSSQEEVLRLQELMRIQSEENSSVSSEVTNKETLIKELNLKVNMLEIDVQSNINIISEKDKQLSVIMEDVKRKNEEKLDIETKLNIANSEVNVLRQKLDSIIAEKSGSEGALKDQLDQIEKLNNSIASLSREKDLIGAENNEIKQKLDIANQTLSDKQNELQLINDKLKSLEHTITEKDSVLHAVDNNYKLKEKELNHCKTQLNNLEKLMSEKDTQLNKIEKDIISFKEQSITESNKNSSKVNEVINELENSKRIHKIEKDNLMKTIESYELKIKEFENKIEEMNGSLVTINELKSTIAKNEVDIKQLTKINEGQKANYEDLNSKLQSEYDLLKKESKVDRHNLKDRIREKESLLKESNDKLERSISAEKVLEEKFREAQKRIADLENKVDIMSLSEKSASEKDNMLEKISSEINNVKAQNLQLSAANEELNEMNKKELQHKGEIIANLQKDLMNQRAKTEILEREKVLLEKELSGAKNNITSTRDKQYNTESIQSQGDNKVTNLLENKEMLDGQVSFLNSVIVDMQRKNEQLLARVQALESGFSPDEVNEFQFNGLKSPKVAPRLYCDICEVFDAHDTEDCPRQRGSTPSSPKKEKKPRPPPRPYCDICEVFGHTTEDCNEEETY